MDEAADRRFLTWANARVQRLHRTTYLMCGDWHLAEDIVQDVLTKVALHWSSVERASSPDAYVHKVLVNQVRQRWRRPARTRERVTDVIDPPPVGDGTNERAERDRLLTALRQLPIRQRTAVVLRYFDDMSEADTAVALACSVGTVKSQTSRALKR